MNNKLTEFPDKKTMSSLEIAELTGKDHPKVIADIKRILDEVEIDTAVFGGIYLDNMKRERPLFNLHRRECDLVIAGYSAKYRLAIIDRWQELEYQQSINLPDFTNPALAVRAWADEVEAKLIALDHIKEKDQLLIASNEASIKAGEILVREFVKTNDLIDIGEKLFLKWLRDQDIILKTSREPYQPYVKLGYLTWKPSNEEYGGKVRYQLRITPRGKVWLAAKHMAYLDKEMAA